MPVKISRAEWTGGFFETKGDVLASARRRVQMTGRARVILFDSDVGATHPWHHMALMEKYGVGRDHPDFVEAVYYDPGA